ncbi:pyrazinamidase/nicotinamidase [Calycina marina]|uniref:nicotinamidase n=1 Tax=Calycina marina TaxID=1763456 RepID=A0A9P7ZAT1_9HELO|nr:pyrazinamidase/nicotinamidase [Calycina marina]
MAPTDIKKALIIVDLQEDFCPPNGSLAVPNGRDIIPTVNKLLDMPFTIKIATKDWHPPDHISFAANHLDAQPYTSNTTIINPSNPEETYETRLWPVHCVQNTPGAELLSELDLTKIDRVVEKGQRREVEMYSAFYDPLTKPRCSDSGLVEILRKEGVEEVYVVGLAADYCVKATAIDAKKEGFRTIILEEGTRAVHPTTWDSTKAEIQDAAVEVVRLEQADL